MAEHDERGRSESTQTESNPWRPIETAPDDEQHILVCDQERWASVHEAYFSVDRERYYLAQTHWTDAIDGELTQVTHWMPLPEPPADT